MAFQRRMGVVDERIDIGNNNTLCSGQRTGSRELQQFGNGLSVVKVWVCSGTNLGPYPLDSMQDGSAMVFDIADPCGQARRLRGHPHQVCPTRHRVHDSTTQSSRDVGYAGTGGCPDDDEIGSL